jgi:hypothetical protein
VESVVAAQIVRLFAKKAPAVWELVETSEPVRDGDVILYDEHGVPIGYARPISPR